MTASPTYAKPPAPALDPDMVRVADTVLQRLDGSVVMIATYAPPDDDGEGNEAEAITFAEPMILGGL